MNTKLAGIAAKAASDQKLRFTALAHLLTPEFMKETWCGMNKRGSYGVDGTTAAEFKEGLEERLNNLWEQLKNGNYRASAVRRVEIPKPNGGVRLLGLPTVEDRVLQACVARILSAVFEKNFLECSFGYRPGLSPHEALKHLRAHIVKDKVSFIHEADIRSYFDRVNHDWLRRMLRLRIADPVILRLIDKWLRAGVMDAGVLVRNEDGVPQGGPISPILANIYLHYVLDLWFELRFKPTCRGTARLIRFADDFLTCFQSETDARRFESELPSRLGKFQLELSPTKTKLLQFGRFARERMAILKMKPATFDFLGFTHVCGTSDQGKFIVISLPSKKTVRRFLDRTHQWLVAHMHWKPRDQQIQLSMMLKGFYQYYALRFCTPKLSGVQHEVERQWRNVLRRRGGRRKSHWNVLERRPWFNLPSPVLLHPEV